MRALSLERRILLLVLLPLLGGLVPALLIVLRAHSEVTELRQLGLLSEMVWKLGALESRLAQEFSNWYMFMPRRLRFRYRHVLRPLRSKISWDWP